MAEGSVYFGAVAGSYACGLCFAKFGYQVHFSISNQDKNHVPSQTVFFASCGLNTLGLLYSLFYMSNIKVEKASSDSEK